MNRIQTNFGLSQELSTQLADQANAKGITKSEIIEQAVEQYLERKSDRQIPPPHPHHPPHPPRLPLPEINSPEAFIPGNMQERSNFDLSQELIAQLTDCANAEGITEVEILEQALRHYLDAPDDMEQLVEKRVTSVHSHHPPR